MYTYASTFVIGVDAKFRRSGTFQGRAEKCIVYQTGEASAQATSAESIIVRWFAQIRSGPLPDSTSSL